MRSNVAIWKALQDEDYFEKHPCYKGLTPMGDYDCKMIETFIPLTPGMSVTVIGCGYGRETLSIAPKVGRVFGIDVSERILTKAQSFLAERGVHNFTPVLVEQYKGEISATLDLVYSIVVTQHLTRDLVQDYLSSLGAKLSPSGRMLIQFLQERAGDLSADVNLALKAEPSISWTPFQIADAAKAAGLSLLQIRTIPASDAALYHWAFIGKNADRPGFGW